jgi:hypothetical protein
VQTAGRLGLDAAGVPGPRSRALRDDLITYLLCDSPDRARLISELLVRNPGMGDLLAELEADDDLRAKLEMELLGG